MINGPDHLDLSFPRKSRSRELYKSTSSPSSNSFFSIRLSCNRLRYPCRWMNSHMFLISIHPSHLIGAIVAFLHIQNQNKRVASSNKLYTLLLQASDMVYVQETKREPARGFIRCPICPKSFINLNTPILPSFFPNFFYDSFDFSVNYLNLATSLGVVRCMLELQAKTK